MAGLSGQTASNRTFSLDAMTDEIVQIYRKSFKDAVMIETRAMEAELSKTLRNVTFKNVYSYPAKNKNRRYYHGGLADPQYYAFEAVVHGDDDIQVVFYQKEEIPHESYDDDAPDAIKGYDTRMIVEEGSIFFRQPPPRLYFDETAQTLAVNLPENIDRRIKQSMRMRGM